MGTREAQVKAEYRDWYPALEPGVWYPAARLADGVRSQLREGAPRWEPGARVLKGEHFLFRGGEDQRAPEARTRAGDG